MKPAFWCTATMRLRMSAGSASSSGIGKRLIAFMAGVYLTNMRRTDHEKQENAKDTKRDQTGFYVLSCVREFRGCDLNLFFRACARRGGRWRPSGCPHGTRTRKSGTSDPGAAGPTRSTAA